MSLVDHAIRVASSAVKNTPLQLGPWEGSMRSVPDDRVPPEFMTDGLDMLYIPRHGAWKRRGGQTIKFDTFGAAVGLLPAKWSSKCRQVEEFTSDSISDNVPSVMALLTKETIASGLDDGRFSNVWLRDQVNNANYTVGSEFNVSTYPPPGDEQNYKFIPLWYDSGDGGLTRGASEFSRRFFFSGSRRMLKVGNWHYFPSVLGTPSRWNGIPAGAGALSALDGVSDDENSFLVQSEPSGSARWGISDLAGGSLEYNAASCDIANNVITIAAGGANANIKVGDIITGTGTVQPIYVVSVDLDTQVTAGGTGSISNDTGRSHDFWRASTFLANDQSPADTGFVYINNVTFQTLSSTMTWDNLDSDYTRWQIAAVLKLTVAYAGTHQLYFRITLDDGNIYESSKTSISGFTDGSYFTETWDINTGDGAVGTGTINKVQMFVTGTAGSEAFAPGLYMAGLTITPVVNADATDKGRLIPSGPIPPCHAGTMAKGNVVAGGAVTELGSASNPHTDSVDGAWLNSIGTADLSGYVQDDEDDTKYIVCATGAATCELAVANPGFTPTSATHTAEIVFRARKTNLLGTAPTLAIELVTTTGGGGGTVTATVSHTGTPTTFVTTRVSLSAAQIGAVDWPSQFLRLNVAGATGSIQVSSIYLVVTPIQSEIGGWKGHDRFFRAIAYRFEDDSIFLPSTPRAPNSILEDGLDLFTVDSDNPELSYDKVTWNNLPIPPNGVKSLLLLRSTKIDSTEEDNLQLDPHDLRVVWEVDAGTTTYDDYFADDDSLALDVSELLIREDLIMPPRARYVFGGDSRVCHSYGGNNPAAIVIAPISHTAAASAGWDLNVADDSSAAYGSGKPMFMKLDLDGSSVATLKFGYDTTNVNSIALAGLTLQKVVDTINATTEVSTGRLWRAQLSPGASPDADATTALLPHSRVVASCVVTDTLTTLTKAAGGLSKVAVGAVISKTGVTAGTYVTAIVSDTELTMSAAATSTSTSDATFYFDLGDTPTGATIANWQRVIANSLPGFLYFNKTYLDKQTFDKSRIWMTTASPGSMKSAPNCFSGKISNQFTPPLDAGISMGGAAVDNGFVVPYAKKNAVIRNLRDTGSGLDEDYRLLMLNEGRGCCAWNSVGAGSRFAHFFSPEGMVACNLEDEILLSESIYRQSPTEIGDFSYEAPLCIAATGMDDDTAYLSARVMRGALFINYRSTGSHPNRQVIYDFSSGTQSSGLLGLVRSPGRLWGWSTPLSRSFTAMTEGRRSATSHLYGWNEANAGSAGDGRIDEFQVTEADNGSAIASASVRTPYITFGNNMMSAQEATLEHHTPTGATVSFKLHRSHLATPDSYTLTPSTTAGSNVIRENKMFTLPARTPTAACYLEWLQSAGTATELRAIELRAKVLPVYGRGPSYS